MTGPRGIAGDIARPVRRPPVQPRAAPLPPDMPRRHSIAPQRSGWSWRHAWDLAQYPLIAALAVAASTSTTIGQILVVVYVVITLLSRRQSSGLSFGLALLILVSIPVFTLLGHPGIAANAAIYVFELLVVGTIQAILESKQTSD